MSDQTVKLQPHEYQRFLQGLPKDWDRKEIRQLGTVVGGGTPSRDVPSFWRGTIPWATPGEVSGLATKFLYDTNERISASGLAGSGANLLPAGSLMVTTRATLGARAINAVPMTTNQGFKSIVFKQAADSGYYIHLFHMVQPELVRRASGTTFLEISGTEFGGIEVPSPSPGEKRLISEILDTLDTAIHETEAIIAKLKDVKQGLLHDLLTRGIDVNGDLRPPQDEAPHIYKESPLGWIPRDWRFGSIESCLDRIIDYRGKTPTKTSSGIPLITAKNVRLGYIDREPQEFIGPDSFDGWMTRGIPRRGDLLFTTEAPLGNVAQIDTDEQLAFAQRMIILQVNNTVVDTFLKFLILGQQFRKRLFAMGSGSTVEGIKQSTFRRISVAVPGSVAEQHEIAQRLTSMELRVDRELTFLGKLQQTKSGLMDDLLTGRVRVTPLLAETAQQQRSA